MSDGKKFPESFRFQPPTERSLYPLKRDERIPVASTDNGHRGEPLSEPEISEMDTAKVVISPEAAVLDDDTKRFRAIEITEPPVDPINDTRESRPTSTEDELSDSDLEVIEADATREVDVNVRWDELLPILGNERVKKIVKRVGETWIAKKIRKLRAGKEVVNENRDQERDPVTPEMGKTSKNERTLILEQLVLRMEAVSDVENQIDRLSTQIDEEKISKEVMIQDKKDSEITLKHETLPTIERQLQYLKQFPGSLGSEFTQIVDANYARQQLLDGALDQLNTVLVGLATKADSQRSSRFRAITKNFDEVNVLGMKRLAGDKLFEEVTTLRHSINEAKSLTEKASKLGDLLSEKETIITTLTADRSAQQELKKRHRQEIERLRNRLAVLPQ